MSINVYARCSKLPDCVGRLDYISSPDRQEYLVATAGCLNENFWQQLAAESRESWRRSGSKSFGTEALEIMLQIPNVLPKELLDEISDDIREKLPGEEQQKGRAVLESLKELIKEKYGVEAALGMHWNKTQRNLHIHAMFADRALLPLPEMKIATRRTWIDEEGRQRKAKKDICDENGELRPGCRIVEKGQPIYTKFFSEKNTLFYDRGWLADMKADMADWINEKLQPDEKRVVFDPTGPYLAQQHIGKGSGEDYERRKEAIEKYNESVKSWNELIKSGEVSKELAYDVKHRVMLSPDKHRTLLICKAERLVDDIGDDRYEGYAQTPEEPRTEIKSERDRDKERLREMYRGARLARNARDEAKARSDFKEQAEWSKEARAFSAEIDRLKAKLGLFSAEEERRRRKKEDQELSKLRDNQMWAWKELFEKAGDYFSNLTHNFNMEQLKQALDNFDFEAAAQYRAQLNEDFRDGISIELEAAGEFFDRVKAYKERKAEIREERRERRAAKAEAKAERQHQEKTPDMER